MGYNAFAFKLQVQPWLDAGWLKPGHLLIEFGAQEFNHPDTLELHRELSAFLAALGVAADRIKTALGDELPSVPAIYEALGVKYYSIDVDGAHGSTFFDLNSAAPPAYWRGVFDFVNNEGTIEHLANPMNGFQVAHELAKPGGVIRHNFPLVGWHDHGFFYGTTKLYAHLVGDNGYEVLQAQVFATEPTPFEDPLFTSCLAVTSMVDNAPKQVPFPKVTNLWGELIYRKVNDRPFVIPVDHVGGPGATAARQRLIENYRRLVGGRIS
jgi:SAM-dependent methyltransferase